MAKYTGIYRGNLRIGSDDDVADLTEVAGSVYIGEGASLTANALTKAGSVYIGEGASLTANALTKAGSVDIGKGASLTANALTEVAGSVYIGEGASLTANALTEVAGSVYIGEGASLTANALIADIFYEIADAEYILYANSVSYKAGCRGPWDAKKSLAHWKRTDARAVTFTAAIVKHEAAKSDKAA